MNVTGTSQTGQSSPLRQDIQTLQSALQANDLAGAQKALTSFQHDLQQADQAHHYRHHHGGGQGGVLQTLASFVSGLYRGSSDFTSSSSGTSSLSVTV